MAFFSRYAITRRLPASLRFRNGVVLLECVRDCSTALPTWVFRARKPAPSLSPVPSSSGRRAAARPLPTVSPIALAAAADLRERGGAALVIASSIWGRRDLERILRCGVVLAEGSPEARVMAALVRLDYAMRMPASSRGR